MPPYRIANWEKHYETYEAKRGRVKRMAWVPIKNKHDGEGFSLLIVHRKGVEHFGAFVLMVEVASKCDPRGTLIRDDGTAHTPASLSAKTRASAQSFKSAIPRLLEVGWLEDLGTQQDMERSGKIRRTPDISASTLPDPTLPDPIGSDPTRPIPDKSGSGPRRARPPKWTDDEVRAIYDAYPRHVAPDRALPAIRKALDRIAAEDFNGQQTPPEWLLIRVQKYAAAWKGRDPIRAGRDVRPYPATWINDARYDDDETEWKKS